MALRPGPGFRAGKAAGRHIHMGRVNSVRRLEYAQQIGVDTVDGSGIARFPPTLARLSRFLDQPAVQLSLPL